MIDKDLQAVGLQEKEAKVYLAALELGKGTAQQIAQKADLKRPTTYVIVEELMQQGLVSSYYEGKKQYFVAENPERLTDMLRNQKQEVEKREEQLQALLPQLQSINNRQTDKPVVKYYEGKDGVISMVKDCDRTSQSQEVLMAYSRDAVKAAFDDKTLKELGKNRLDQHVKARVIYTWEAGDIASSENSESIKLSHENFPITCDIAVYNDKLRITSLKNRLIGVVIEDKEIAKSFKAIYELAWKWVKYGDRKND